MEQSALRKRRRALMKKIGDGIAIVATAPEQTRNNDVLFPFRPDSDFYYLTGFAEPAAAAVFAPGRAEGEFLLFCRASDAEAETWNGRRAGLGGARETYAADQAFAIGDLEKTLPSLLENRAKIFYNIGRHPGLDALIAATVAELRARARTGVKAPADLSDIGAILHEMRLIKSADELRTMKRAAAVTVAAHTEAMRSCAPGMMEYQVQAEVERAFRQHGAAPAYPSIVAGGANACILHYTENNCGLRGGDLLLVDAGAEVDCYAADITRTIPVNGTFTPAQKDVMDIVISARDAAISEVRPGASVNRYHETAVRVLARGLLDLKLLRGSVDRVVDSGAYKKFYMHRTGHWLGMDVHDVGDYKVNGAWRALKPGMVLTVEPGLYLAGDDVPAGLRGTGVRVEDDVLVTKSGSQVLTAAAPSTPAAVEEVMAR
ncbi:MAG: aminopeptidase P N-terminal domain-containing protein [Gammaproteobacteria bacterium]|nr:aminopeptidase P N-terminal domain-containing protein [Gammaproteobacteria bacterium]